jgi:cell division protein FtsI/penicillin-binding protein 2
VATALRSKLSAPRLLIAAFSLLFAVIIAPSLAPAQQATLFAQGANAVLQGRFRRPELSWILLDRTGSVLAQQWDAPNVPIPPGSLLKPFVAIAYAEQHGDRFPRVRCLGTPSLCWLPRGHGDLDLEHAIANSCNAYFLSLAENLDRGAAIRKLHTFGLAGPGPEADARTLIGLSPGWRETPLALGRAYIALLDYPSLAVRTLILRGMAGAASYGTAEAVDADLGKDLTLAKTGTASCTHPHRASADGFAVVLLPADQPRYLLLVRMHGTTGARTAAVAAEMLRAIGLGQP